MCELILNTVGDPDFVKLFYGDTDEMRTYVDRASILQDLYLNTPDKGLNETPLHFATKFGLKDCVRTLLSYQQCMKNPLNKYHQTPGDVSCLLWILEFAYLLIFFYEYLIQVCL